MIERACLILERDARDSYKEAMKLPDTIRALSRQDLRHVVLR